jgi:hypothetical protein
MPPDAMTATETEVLAKRIVSLERDAQQLAQALAQSQRTRGILILALAVFVGVSCYAYYGLATRFLRKDQMDLLVRKAQDRMEQRSDFMMKEVQALVDHSAPVVSQAFYDQAKKDLPAYLQAIQSERDTFTENLQARLEERLQAHHQKLLERHLRLLKEEFPAVEDERLHAAMTANLQVAVNKLARKYYTNELKVEMLSMYGIWDEFPAAAPSAEGDVATEDQLIGALLELLRLKIAQSPAPLVSSSP